VKVRLNTLLLAQAALGLSLILKVVAVVVVAM
jgi:hypothetical protein